MSEDKEKKKPVSTGAQEPPVHTEFCWCNDCQKKADATVRQMHAELSPAPAESVEGQPDARVALNRLRSAAYEAQAGDGIHLDNEWVIGICDAVLLRSEPPVEVVERSHARETRELPVKIWIAQSVASVYEWHVIADIGGVIFKRPAITEEQAKGFESKAKAALAEARESKPRCPKCGSASLSDFHNTPVMVPRVYCSQCKSRFDCYKLEHFAQFFFSPSPESKDNGQ